MAEYHVGCGNFGIYAGTLKKNGYEWMNKTEVTNEVLSAAAQYLLGNDKYFGFEYRGKTYTMRVHETAEDIYDGLWG